MPKYENSIIYKLCHCNDLENENIYIGSTTNFRIRKNKHKSNCNNEKSKDYNIFVYQFIRDNGGWNEWQMIPIEVYPCNDKKELEVRERHHIELLKPKLNKQIPTRTKTEYNKVNKEKLNEKKKKYCDDNKKKVKEYKKKYRDNNKEVLNEKQKDYYEANKEIINQKAKEKVICDRCGGEISKSNFKKHQKTKKCIETV